MKTFRLRLGVLLFVTSWLPIAQAILIIANDNGKLTGESASNAFRLIVWGIQILMGFIAIWLAGSVSIKEAKKKVGRKPLPSFGSYFGMVNNII